MRSESARRHPVRRLGGWECKPYAILHSPFREVLWLDADNVPLVDPSCLFAEPAYAETGAIFWPDLTSLPPDHPIWTICRVPWRDEPEFESGQIVLDKARCWDALQLTMHLNEWSDFYYRYVYGDKETFHLAWRMLDQPYAMPTRLPSQSDRVLVAGAGRPTAAPGRCSSTTWPAARVVPSPDQHREVEPARREPQIRRVPVRRRSAGRRWPELGQRWDGWVKLPPRPSRTAAHRGRDRGGPALPLRPPRHRRTDARASAGQAGSATGAAAAERTLAPGADDAGGPTLVIAGDYGDICRLRPGRGWRLARALAPVRADADRVDPAG